MRISSVALFLIGVAEAHCQYNMLGFSILYRH